MDGIVSHTNTYVYPKPQNMTLFGNRALTDAVRYQYNQATLDLGRPYYDRCPYEKTRGYTEDRGGGRMQ